MTEVNPCSSVFPRLPKTMCFRGGKSQGSCFFRELFEAQMSKIAIAAQVVRTSKAVVQRVAGISVRTHPQDVLQPVKHETILSLPVKSPRGSLGVSLVDVMKPKSKYGVFR